MVILFDKYVIGTRWNDEQNDGLPKYTIPNWFPSHTSSSSKYPIFPLCGPLVQITGPYSKRFK